MKLKLILLILMLFIIPMAMAQDVCYATDVYDFSQGLDSYGDPVVAIRSDPTQALGMPEQDDTFNFVSLGFGGELILEFSNPIVNVGGDDFTVIETSFGNPACDAYPEKVRVYASEDAVSWTDLGSGCLDTDFDLGGLSSASYLKFVDETNSEDFSGRVDGYDVDGVIANCEIDDEIPEFSVIGAMLVLGLAGLFIHKKR